MDGWRYVVNKRDLNLKFKFNYIFKIILNIFFHIATLNFKKHASHLQHC